MCIEDCKQRQVDELASSTPSKQHSTVHTLAGRQGGGGLTWRER